MSDELSTVMTVYVHNNAIDNFSISRLKKEDAEFFCKTINSLKIEGEQKVYAKIINPNTKYSLNDFTPLTFDIFPLQNDKAIQKLMTEIDSQELCKALKGASKGVQDKVFGNVSERAASMLKEDMEYLGEVRKSEAKEAQEKILGILSRLEELGEITIVRGE